MEENSSKLMSPFPSPSSATKASSASSPLAGPRTSLISSGYRASFPSTTNDIHNRFAKASDDLVFSRASTTSFPDQYRPFPSEPSNEGTVVLSAFSFFSCSTFFFCSYTSIQASKVYINSIPNSKSRVRSWSSFQIKKRT